MLFNEGAHLLDRLSNFRCLGAATTLNPASERPCRRRTRLAFAPRNDAKRDSQFPRYRDQTETLRCALNLAIRAALDIGRDKLRDHLTNVFAFDSLSN